MDASPAYAVLHIIFSAVTYDYNEIKIKKQSLLRENTSDIYYIQIVSNFKLISFILSRRFESCTL